MCVKFSHSRASIGGGEGVFPVKLRDDFSVCAGGELIGRCSTWQSGFPGEPAEDDMANFKSLETHLCTEGEGEQTHPIPQKQGH